MLFWGWVKVGNWERQKAFVSGQEDGQMLMDLQYFFNSRTQIACKYRPQLGASAALS